jgi:hypothetical protein
VSAGASERSAGTRTVPRAREVERWKEGWGWKKAVEIGADRGWVTDSAER